MKELLCKLLDTDEIVVVMIDGEYCYLKMMDGTIKKYRLVEAD